MDSRRAGFCKGAGHVSPERQCKPVAAVTSFSGFSNPIFMINVYSLPTINARISERISYLDFSAFSSILRTNLSENSASLFRHT